MATHVGTKHIQLSFSFLFFNFLIFLFMHFCPVTITTQAESINSDLQRGPGQTFTTHTTLNTEQNQLAIKVSAGN